MEHSREGIPDYDAARDKYCPIAQSPKFQRRLKRLKQLERKRTPTKKEPTRKRTLSPLKKPLPSLPLTLSTPSNGITYGTGVLDVLDGKEWRAPASLDPELELETLKSILVRERYIKRLETTLNTWLADESQVVPEDVAMQFDLIRTSTIDVVEHIAKWRLGLLGGQQQEKPPPFNWNGQNYLLKIPSDLDDLDHLRSLQRWAGIPFKRNPFLLPLPLDFRTMPQTTIDKSDSDDDDFDDGDKQQEQSTMMKKGPYNTAVINDPSVLPPVSKKKKLPLEKKLSEEDEVLERRRRAIEAKKQKQQPRMVPTSLVESEEDRVKRAEKVLLDEEAVYGRYRRNKEGRLVPEDVVNREEFVASIAKDEGRPLDEPATAEPETAPHAELAGVGHTLEPEKPPHFLQGDTPVDYEALEKKFLGGEKDEKEPFDEVTSAAERVARVGGVLSEQTAATTMGKRRAPTKRTRGAALDAEVARLHKDATRLLKEMDDLRGENAADLAEVDLLESDAERLENEAIVREELLAKMENPTVDDVQRVKRGQRARENARKRAMKLKDDVARREMKIAELAEARDLRLREATQRSAERFMLKKSLRSHSDRQRALQLEKERRLLDASTVHDADEAAARTLEDDSAKNIQRVGRGKLARLYAVKLRKAYAKAATVINAGARGRFSRIRARFERFKKRGATIIQRHVRGKFAQVAVMKMKHKKQRESSALLVSTLFLGIKARRRLRRRRELRKVAQVAYDAVGVRGLFPADFYDLADAIRQAQCDHRVAYPPAAVLGLLRVVVLLLSVIDNKTEEREDKAFIPGQQQKVDGEHVTELSAIGVRRLLPVERIDLSWNGAMKVLRRAHRFLRRLRALAAGPNSSPPRLLSLPRLALDLFDAYAKDPTMTISAMERLPRGAKACVRLLQYVLALKEVYDLQQFFFDDLGGDEMTPNWLIRKRFGAKKRRSLLANALVNRHAAAYANGAKDKLRAEGKMFPVEARCYEAEMAEMAKTDDALAAHDAAEAVHAMEFAVRIEEDLTASEDRIKVAERHVAVSDQAVKDAYHAVRHEGSRAARARLPGLRDAASEARIGLRESRVKLATSRRDVAVAKKREKTVLVDLPPEVRFRAVAAGEARGSARLALEQRGAWLRTLGGEDHVRRLAKCKPSQEDGSRGNALARLSKEEYAHLVALDTKVAATQDRSAEAKAALERVCLELENELARAEDEERAKTARPSSMMEPTDEERAEDAKEDEFRAYEEMLFARQYVPPRFLPSLHKEIRLEAQSRANTARRAALLSAGADDKLIKDIEASLDNDCESDDDDEEPIPQVVDAEKAVPETDTGIARPFKMKKTSSEWRPVKRPRPVLLLIARDVAGAAKAKIIAEVTMQLEGLFVRVDASELDAMAFQGPLSVGRSIVADVDPGLTFNSRVAFLDALKLTKAAFIPTPHVVLVLGDARNRRGPGLPAPPEHFGTAVDDLSKMTDRLLKEHYEDAAENLSALSKELALAAFLSWANLQYPPSKGHALVLEAAIVLLQKSTRFRDPAKTVAAVSWIAARRLLAQPVELVSRLRDIDPASLPPETLVTLREYASASDWPKPVFASVEDDEDEEEKILIRAKKDDDRWRDAAALTPLIQWLDAVVQASDYLNRHGGAAPTVSRHEMPDVVAAVVTVTDGMDIIDEDSEATSRGWRAAFARLAASVLEDCRGYRCAAELARTSVISAHGIRPPETVYTVSVYHDCGRIFFTAYDPTDSVTLFTSIHEREVNGLLAPNSIERAAHAGKSPPTLLSDMYSRLVALLVIERGTGMPVAGNALTYNKQLTEEECRLIGKPYFVPQGSKSPPRLVCRRRLHRLLRETRRISGYLATVTAYEESRGELRFHAYLPERAANVETRVDARLLNKIYVNADTDLGELDAVESREAPNMLNYVTDRLEVVPGKAQADDMGCLLTSTIPRSGGFHLKVRSCQGPGRRLYRRPVVLHGTMQKALVMTVYDATDRITGRLLRVRIYDPVSSEERELRFSRTHRALLLGSIGPDWRSWHQKLVDRLSLLRRTRLVTSSLSSCSGVFESDGLSVDATIFKGVVPIDGRAARVKVTMLPGEALVITVFDVDRPVKQRLTQRQKMLQRSFNVTNLEQKTTTKGVFSSRIVVDQEALITIWDLPRGTTLHPVFDVLCGVGFTTATPATDKRRQRGLGKLLACLGRDPETGAVLLTVESHLTVREERVPLPISERAPPKEPHDGTVAAVVRTRIQAPVLVYKTKDLLLDDETSPVYRHKTTPAPAASFDDDTDVLTEAIPPPPPPSNKTEDAETATAAPIPAAGPLGTTDERVIWQRGVRVVVKPFGGEFTREVVFVKVFETYTSGYVARELRLKVYRSETAQAEDIRITGLQGLREVLGSKAQHLIEPERQDEMLQFIVAERLVLYEGVWDADGDAYVRAGGRFTPKLTSQHLFDAGLKVTPVHLGGDADAAANADVLFDEKQEKVRGRKILRQAQDIDGVLIHVTAFEMPIDDASEDAVPPLRYVCYNPRAKFTHTVTVEPKAVAEVLQALDDAIPEAINKPSTRLRQGTKRFDLARAVASKFRLECLHGAPPQVYLPWSQHPVAMPVSIDTFDPAAVQDDLQPGAPQGTRAMLARHPRPPEDRIFKRPNRLLRRATTVSGFEAVVSIFGPSALDVNVYLPKLERAVELHLDLPSQRDAFGTALVDHSDGEPRDAYLTLLIRHLKIDDLSLEEPKRSTNEMRLRLAVDPSKPWLDAYKSLDTGVPVQANRPEGHPVRFIPADTRGDLVLRKGIALPSGGDVICSVYSKAKDEPARHGVVIEAYDPVTSYTAVLHVVASALLAFVGQDEAKLDDVQTFGAILDRLDVHLAPGGGLNLRISKPSRIKDDDDYGEGWWTDSDDGEKKADPQRPSSAGEGWWTDSDKGDDEQKTDNVQQQPPNRLDSAGEGWWTDSDDGDEKKNERPSSAGEGWWTDSDKEGDEI